MVLGFFMMVSLCSASEDLHDIFQLSLVPQASIVATGECGVDTGGQALQYINSEIEKVPMYKITIGSTNRVKVQALEETLRDYQDLGSYEVCAVDVPSQVSDQPLSLEETVQGAVNRAKNSFKDCDFSVGIESGLFQVPHTSTGYMAITVCAIYDGTECYIGISSAFECPPKITALMVNDGLDMNQAFHKVGLTNDKKLGSSIGAISILTGGRIDRVFRTKEAIVMALIKLERRELFERY